MNYDFFASKEDKIEILEFIFKETNLHVYDLVSKYDQKVNRYQSVYDITSRFDLDDNKDLEITFILWSSDFKGQVFFRKSDLNPQYFDGSTFRYSTEGWGLIQLHFGAIENNRLDYSNLFHFNETEALKIASESNNDFSSIPADWDWTNIHNYSKKLWTFIQSKTVENHISDIDVLKGAALLEKTGIQLRSE
jgi:hypothetical protein